MCPPILRPLPPPSSIPLDYLRAPALSALLHASNLHWSSILHMIIYMFQCYSLKSSHPCLLPHSPKVCLIHSLIKKKVTVWPYDTDHNDQCMILFNRKTVYTWVEPVKDTHVYKYLSKNTFPLLSVVQFHLGTVQEVFPRFRRNLKGSTKI